MYVGPGEPFLHKWHQEILVQRNKKLSSFLFEHKTAHHQSHDQLDDLYVGIGLIKSSGVAVLTPGTTVLTLTKEGSYDSKAFHRV
ncbi:hypothetical protein Tco_0443933 [Tanacetum coccineum]